MFSEDTIGNRSVLCVAEIGGVMEVSSKNPIIRKTSIVFQ